MLQKKMKYSISCYILPVITMLLYVSSQSGALIPCLYRIQEEVEKAAAPLLGSPSVFASSDPSLLTDFDIPQTSTWALIAVKDHDLHNPVSVLHERASTADKMKSWLLSHRLPTSLELTQDTFQNVMNAPQAPLVVIAGINEVNRQKVAARVKELGQKWRLRSKGTGLANSREIVFTWMDGERWKKWLKSMYGIEHDEDEEDLDDVPVVIADHKVY
jgi:thioredoxin domain-containing protein 5